jgi:hypothetical protein
MAIKIVNQSNEYSLNSTDYKKIAKGAAIAFGAAFLFSISDWLITGQIDWILFKTICLPAAISTGINALIKYLQGKTK